MHRMHDVSAPLWCFVCFVCFVCWLVHVVVHIVLACSTFPLFRYKGKQSKLEWIMDAQEHDPFGMHEWDEPEPV
jgi:hypothetical protein